ncbi:MAG TPA: hypothetical protein VM260_28060 [Pirellula sp.]|nr:hypothetical protein [Pirellula sp.]
MEKLPFDYRRVFSAMNRNSVSYLLVGGLNYFLAHKPVTTQDIDLLIDDTPENRSSCENALIDLFAEWGRRDEDWGPVCAKPRGWLWGQNVFCLLTQFGPVDIFISLPGISSYAEAKQESIAFQVDNDLQIQLISARDLLECQMALPEIYRKPERIHYLRGVVENDR